MRCPRLLPTSGSSRAGRYAAAIVLTIGFYVLALVIGIGLIAGPVLGGADGTGNICVADLPLVAGDRDQVSA